MPLETAQLIASTSYLPALLDIALISADGYSDVKVAENYFLLRNKTGVDQLLVQSERIVIEAEWQKVARAGLIDDLSKFQANLTRAVMSEDSKGDCDVWFEMNREALHPLRPILATIKSGGRPDLSLLGYAVRQIQRMVV
jgi:NAD-specific glutamate dehydrogenase